MDSVGSMAAPTEQQTDAPRRLAVRVSKDALRHVRHGHPWVYGDSVESVKPAGTTGDLAIVFDDDNRFAAVGLYDSGSPLRVRILHAGKPATIDAAWFATRIDAALDRRAGLAADQRTDGYRCIHGENDGLPGLVVDRYAATLVVKLDTAAWLPHLGTIVPLLEERLLPDHIVLRASRTVSADALRRVPGAVPAGDALVIGGSRASEPFAEPVLFHEYGLTFEAHVLSGQKTGHFLDQRENRRRVSQLAKDADVLDVFSCTGGFSVHAAAGGARSVHSVDLSAQAIETVAANLAHNNHIPSVRHCVKRSTVGDAFQVMEQIRGEHFYGVVVVDPPSFAHKQVDVDRALRAYTKLTSSAVPLVDHGGVLVQSSCSSRVDVEQFENTVLAMVERTGRSIRGVERTGHPVDHPIGFAEGAYLKTVFITLA
jgi:23S rRNA (cytosine1962-C5)-methyltransferase